MNISIEEYKDYRKGRLSSEQTQSIQDYLNEHPLERKSLEGSILMEQIPEIDQLWSRMDAKMDTLIQAEVPVADSAPAKKKNNLRYISIITGVAAGIAILLMMNPMGTKSLSIDEYVSPYPDVLTDIVRGDVAPDDRSDITTAMSEYRSGEYAEAYQSLAELIKENPDNRDLAFYKAICAYEIGKYEEGLQTFEQLMDPEAQYAYDDGAIWYAALSYIKIGKDNKAKELLRDISAMDHYKSEAAGILLERYDHIK